MSWRFNSVALSLVMIAFSAWIQLPPDQKLAAEDERAFNEELKRLEKLLSTANDKDAIELQIANTYAAGGQFSKAIRRLRRVVGANVGFDPSSDIDFRNLRGTAEFQSIMDDVRRQTEPVHNSRLIATLQTRDVRPENIAFDSKRSAFILGNTARFELVKCSLTGACVPFVTPHTAEKGYVLGLKIDSAADAVWATNNTTDKASLRCYDLETGELKRTASIEGRHAFNDLAISSTGTVYVTDTAASSVYQLSSGTVTLQRIAPQHTFTDANGIAISADEKLLYVSTWEDGLDVIDVQSGVVMAVIHPSDVGLAFIDGLYAMQRSLIAIQNGLMLPRIVEFRLSENGRQKARLTSF